MQELLQSLKIDTGGLVTAIAQDADTGEVLMVAWMNADALRQTLKTGLAHYWSRSRRALWRKGEKSGHVQKVREIRTDCDKDVLLLKVEQIGGAACHTGYRSCFSWRLQEESWVEEGEKIFNPEDKYGKK
ncbi:MAG: phosphoribosyl-AMP cyclohydrolase [Planctomycetes bacterium]|nr:phosphoribosyl-AMP cyclohydrolase [Planctomycetota bacterium]MBE3097234.1 phosphoribosyl-AMP cyclohydrolase [Planctomycetota bacterium]